MVNHVAAMIAKLEGDLSAWIIYAQMQKEAKPSPSSSRAQRGRRLYEAVDTHRAHLMSLVPFCGGAHATVKGGGGLLSCRRPKLLRVVTFGGGIVDDP